MESTTPANILATGFVADLPSEASRYPSAGRDSSSAAFQAIYWRCICVLMYSARLNNPGLRLLLFTNVTPPAVNGIDVNSLLVSWGVEIVVLPLTHRIADGRATSWGNVFYFLDIAEYLARFPSEVSVALIDTDVIVTGSLKELFTTIDTSGFVMYEVGTAPDHDVNGMAPREMANLATEIFEGTPLRQPVHYGGELLGVSVRSIREELPAMRELWNRIHGNAGPETGIRTEEHFWSVLLSGRGISPATAGFAIKRMWTSPRLNTVRPGDEAIPLWHLPAEKRYGFNYLFMKLKSDGFDLSVAPGVFRERAGLLCGVPRKTALKTIRDGYHQAARRLTIRRIRSRATE